MAELRAVAPAWVRTWPATLASWCLTRCGLLALAALPGERGALSDVGYYHTLSLQVWCQGMLPGRDFPWEYPPGALPFAAPPLGCGGFPSYLLAFMTLALLLDLLVLVVLRAGAHGPRAAGVWLLLVPLLGPIAITRFDVSVCLVVALAFLQLRRRPEVAGVLLVAAASIKLWPILLLLVLVRSPVWRRILRGAAAGAVALALLFLSTGALPAFSSAVGFQRDRGLHIESVLAVPYAWLRVAGVGGTTFDHGAWEVAAPGAGAVAQLAGLVQVLLVAALGAAVLRSARTTADREAAFALALTTLLVVTNKVLSPQYLLWVVVMLALAAGTAYALPRRYLVLAGLCAVSTHLLYPALYDGVRHGGVAATLVMTARDATLLLLTAKAVRAALFVPSVTAPTTSHRPALPLLQRGSP